MWTEDEREWLDRAQVTFDYVQNEEIGEDFTGAEVGLTFDDLSRLQEVKLASTAGMRSIALATSGESARARCCTVRPGSPSCAPSR